MQSAKVEVVIQNFYQARFYADFDSIDFSS